MPKETKEPSLGVLYEKNSKEGKTYYSGYINNKRVVMFPIENNKNEKKPCFAIYKKHVKEEK